MRQLLVNMWISPHYLDFSSVLIPTTKARDRHQILFLLGEQHRRQIALIGICGRSVLVSPFYIQSYFSNPIATVDMFNWSRYKILEYSSAWACFSSKGCGEHKIWGVLYHSTFVFFFLFWGGGGCGTKKMEVEGESSRAVHNKDNWKHVWCLKLPSKIKNFHLARWGVPVKNLCPVCTSLVMWDVLASQIPKG